MAQNIAKPQHSIAPWHRNLLMSATVASILLIAMGGILCVTQSIRDCPDWPGCFGKVLPPPEPGPILEVTHRLLAGVSGLLILGTAIAGVVKTPRLPWITRPPIAAVALLLEVSYFGARVVLKGLPPGWAAVDFGSALLVVALMVLSAVAAFHQGRSPGVSSRLNFSNPFTKFAWAATAMVFFVLISGVLVAGTNFITGCLGWAFYSLRMVKMDAQVTGSLLRVILSIAAIGLLLSVVVRSWQMRQKKPAIFRLARMVGVLLLAELVVQALLFIFGFPLALLVVYTITAALFWGLLVVLAAYSSLPGDVPGSANEQASVLNNTGQ